MVVMQKIEAIPEENPKPGLDETGGTSENEASQNLETFKPLNLDEKDPMVPNSTKKMAVTLGAVVVVAGILTGFGLHKLQSKLGSSTLPADEQPMSQVAGEKINNGDIFGSADAETFKDSAQGYLEAGGIEGEGSHKLLRPGGDSQTVYLTSSITDLDKFVSMEIKIWGETFKAQKAGWLMDVGRVEVIETESEAPSED